MQDLQLSDASLAVLLQPRLLPHKLRVDHVRHPPVSLAQQPDEVGPAALDLGQADGQHLALGRLLLGDAPSQVYVGPRDPALLAELAQLREHALDQLVPFRAHVAEGAGHKHADYSFLWRV